MLTLKKGESATKSTKCAEPNVVTCQHSTVHKSLPEDARFQMTWHIDMEKLSEEERDIAAAEYFLIKIRRDFAKVDKPKDVEWDGATFNAKDFVTKRVSKVDKMAKTLATFSDKDLAALGLTRAATED